MRNVTKSEYIPTSNKWEKITKDFKEFRYGTIPYANGEIIFREYVERIDGLTCESRLWRFEFKSETQHILVLDCASFCFQSYSKDVICEADALTAESGEVAYQLYGRRKFTPALFYHIDSINACNIDFLKKNISWLHDAFALAIKVIANPIGMRRIHIAYLGRLKSSPTDWCLHDEELRSIFARERFFVGNCLETMCGYEECYVAAFSNCGYAHRNKVDGDIIPFVV